MIEYDGLVVRVEAMMVGKERMPGGEALEVKGDAVAANETND